MPGGCKLGDRPVDLHMKGLARLGAEFRIANGNIVGEVRGRLRGATLYLGGTQGPTVLGTINVMSAATLAEGTTRIVGAACEPEVADCADLLNRMGACIRGAGTPEIIIEGVESLSACEHRVIPDRIETGTFMIAAAITRGELVLTNACADHLVAFIDHLVEAGISVRAQGDSIVVSASDRPRAVDATTWPYPGLPTDLQAQLMALLAVATGTSVVTERVYPERFLHAAELVRMGASIRMATPTAYIEGVEALSGATVTASDLRASAALVLAGLAARGTTRVDQVQHIDRGYEKIEQKLIAVGADIQRVGEKPQISVVIRPEPQSTQSAAHGAA
jgi:UDP-N-acetylglucosamine 1-carboxyvinyltransferase